MNKLNEQIIRVAEVSQLLVKEIEELLSIKKETSKEVLRLDKMTQDILHLFDSFSLEESDLKTVGDQLSILRTKRRELKNAIYRFDSTENNFKKLNIDAIDLINSVKSNSKNNRPKYRVKTVEGYELIQKIISKDTYINRNIKFLEPFKLAKLNKKNRQHSIMKNTKNTALFRNNSKNAVSIPSKNKKFSNPQNDFSISADIDKDGFYRILEGDKILRKYRKFGPFFRDLCDEGKFPLTCISEVLLERFEEILHSAYKNPEFINNYSVDKLESLCRIGVA